MLVVFTLVFIFHSPRLLHLIIQLLLQPQRMSGVARKRNSKWDLKDDPHVSTTVAQDGVWTGRSGDYFFL